MEAHNHAKESHYPLHFRSGDIETLIDHVKLHHSIELIGMKRVGINNLLRFFLNKKKNFLDEKYMIVMVDLNNLFERDVFAFWRLTLKRITDVVKTSNLPQKVKEKISHAFEISIQTNDSLITFDEIRESVALIVDSGYFPVFIFNRFDRLRNVVSIEFYDNLSALGDAGHSKMSYIFTSYRELEKLFPNVFFYTASSGFSQVLYIKPASKKDSEIVVSQIIKQYRLKIDDVIIHRLIEYSGGHIQYLRLSLLCLHEFIKAHGNKYHSGFFSALENDERIMMQSEELWEGLSPSEQEVVKKITAHERLSPVDKTNLDYMENTGLIRKEGARWRFFSPLFSDYVIKKIGDKASGTTQDFTKQEHKLYTYLKANLNQVCERDQMIGIIWPESNEWGASDWSLDKLVARVRLKLKAQNNPYHIVTVRTRGYKLVEVTKQQSTNR